MRFEKTVQRFAKKIQNQEVHRMESYTAPTTIHKQDLRNGASYFTNFNPPIFKTNVEILNHFA